jgi:formylglycine-generating enzyme required for sulfatase activity
MSGNVWEWTLDDYQTKSSEDLTSNLRRSVRGGCWANFADYTRAAYRSLANPGFRNLFIGFRVACSDPRS